MKTSKQLHIIALLNVFRTVLSIIFPLLTLPYINRVLGIDNIGKINFTTSYINYFILISGLGIATYASREGAKLRGDVTKLNHFANQLFTINLLATGLSYLLLFLSFSFFFTFTKL